MSFHSCKVYHILAALSTTLTQDLQFLLEHSVSATLVGVCAFSGPQYKKEQPNCLILKKCKILLRIDFIAIVSIL